MGIKVEFNQELALRAYNTQGRRAEECLPESLSERTLNWFEKEGHRIYPLSKTCELHETQGNQDVSDPLALILILETTQFLQYGKVWTKGKYEIKEVY